MQIGDGGGEVPAEVNKRGLGKLGAGARLHLPSQWYLFEMYNTSPKACYLKTANCSAIDLLTGSH